MEENDHELTFEFSGAPLVRVKENDDRLLLNKIQAVTNESLARSHGVLNCIDPAMEVSNVIILGRVLLVAGVTTIIA